MIKGFRLPHLLVITVLLPVILFLGCIGGGESQNTPSNSADVSLTKTVNNSFPEVDDNIIFTLRVSNAGPASATDVVVSDELPSGFTYVSDSSGGAYNSNTGRWSIGTVSAGSSTTLDITASVNDTGIYINLAEMTAANDTTPNNNNDGVSAPPPSINVSLNQIQTDCSTNEVTAYVTVVDQDQYSINTLIKDDFTVTENQTELLSNEFDFFVVDRDATPISVVLVLDYSTSIIDSGNVTEMEDAAMAFIDQLFAVDRAEIIKFNKTVQVVQDFTNDKVALKAAVQAAFTPESVTESYKAIIQAVEDAELEPPQNRKAVVYFTDGRNNPDRTAPFVPTVDDVLDTANANSTPIFGIVLGTDFRLGDIEELVGLSEDSGGIFYPSFQSGNLNEIYQKLSNTLLDNQYVIKYTSGLTGGQVANLTIMVVDQYGFTDDDTKQFTSCP